MKHCNKCCKCNKEENKQKNHCGENGGRDNQGRGRGNEVVERRRVIFEPTQVIVEEKEYHDYVEHVYPVVYKTIEHHHVHHTHVVEEQVVYEEREYEYGNGNDRGHGCKKEYEKEQECGRKKEYEKKQECGRKKEYEKEQECRCKKEYKKEQECGRKKEYEKEQECGRKQEHKKEQECGCQRK